ncbi:hypothetical protein THAOC_00912, partial [Thalassiosira oceanica]
MFGFLPTAAGNGNHQSTTGYVNNDYDGPPERNKVARIPQVKVKSWKAALVEAQNTIATLNAKLEQECRRAEENAEIAFQLQEERDEALSSLDDARSMITNINGKLETASEERDDALSRLSKAKTVIGELLSEQIETRQNMQENDANHPQERDLELESEIARITTRSTQLQEERDSALENLKVAESNAVELTKQIHAIKNEAQLTRQQDEKRIHQLQNLAKQHAETFDPNAIKDGNKIEHDSQAANVNQTAIQELRDKVSSLEADLVDAHKNKIGIGKNASTAVERNRGHGSGHEDAESVIANLNEQLGSLRAQRRQDVSTMEET